MPRFQASAFSNQEHASRDVASAFTDELSGGASTVDRDGVLRDAGGVFDWDDGVCAFGHGGAGHDPKCRAREMFRGSATTRCENSSDSECDGRVAYGLGVDGVAVHLRIAEQRQIDRGGDVRRDYRPQRLGEGQGGGCQSVQPGQQSGYVLLMVFDGTCASPHSS